MNAKELKEREYYDSLWQGSWDLATKIGPSCRTRFRILLRLLKKYAADGDIIDTGCGDGRFLGMLAKEGYQNLYGFDFSEEGIRQTQKKGFVLKTFWGDLTRKETLPARQFDVVINSEVLEHIPDYEVAVKNLCGFVGPGGKLFITVPHLMKYWSNQDEFAHHCRRYDAGELEGLLRREGLRILESYTWGSFFYGIYYFMLERSDPGKVMGKAGFLKTILAELIYQILKLDDFLKTKNGRRLIIVAERSSVGTNLQD